MIATTEEQERPYEWIQRIVEGGEYRSLVDEAGDISFAAYRLARALCRIRPVPTSVPTVRELVAAAAEIGNACGIRVPSGTSLAEVCEGAGLLVIEPLHGSLLRVRLAR